MTPLLMPARSAIRASDAWPYPTAAIVSIAAATICARRAASMNEREASWPAVPDSVRMDRI
jgi:hypothetical protein